MSDTERVAESCGCVTTGPIKLGMCNKHYLRHWRELKRDPLRRKIVFPDYFWAKVNKAGPRGCWLWTGVKTTDGYGRTSVGRTSKRAHRVAFELVRGPIPDGFELDHLCRVRACVNPDHLEPVDGATNTRRGTSFAAVNGRKTYCDNGHEFTPENTYIRANRSGRDCRTCINARQVAYRRKLAQEAS